MTFSNPPIDPPKTGSVATSDTFWTFEALEERLVAGLLLWLRAPDREQSWHRVRAYWPDIMRQPWRVDVDGEFDERAATPETRRPALTRDEVAEMEQVAELLLLVPDRDRKLVSIVLGCLARGDKAVPWLRIWDGFGRGRPGPEGLRSRYSRAINALAIQLSR